MKLRQEVTAISNEIAEHMAVISKETLLEYSKQRIEALRQDAKNAAECHVTRANSLPARQAKRNVAVRTSSISGGTAIVLVLCAFLLLFLLLLLLFLLGFRLFLLFSGARITELKGEQSDMNNHASELRVEDRSLNLAIADAELFAAEGAGENGETYGGTETSNLLRAFSQK